MSHTRFGYPRRSQSSIEDELNALIGEQLDLNVRVASILHTARAAILAALDGTPTFCMAPGYDFTSILETLDEVTPLPWDNTKEMAQLERWARDRVAEAEDDRC